MINRISPIIILPSNAAYLNLRGNKRPLSDSNAPRLRRVTSRCLLSQRPSVSSVRPSPSPQPRCLGPRSSLAPSLDTILEEE
ncbi:hypothetical protein DSO57_1007058 [Entomophthora muscae]|uniref:Uncharacterized protein n=1 Tax=Entomophthora muscae TaxID=34485 RepID=A0ACC2S9L8_9FUNG|nr:hypothetical protein DSO57_1007058 [Entomophthora muscae]